MPRTASRIVLALALLSTGCFDSHGGELDPVDGGSTSSDGGIDENDAAGIDENDAGVDAVWVEDTLGWRVRFACGPMWCSPPQADVPADHPVWCSEDFRPYVGTTITGRVPTMLATCWDDTGWYLWGEVARPIVCDSDAICGRMYHVSGRPRCIDGLCQVPEAPLTYRAVLALCLASVPRPTTAPYHRPSAEEEHAFDLTDTFCPLGGDVCQVPPECMPR